MHAENVRSETIGTIEKREGQTIIGNDISAVRNYGIFYFPVGTATDRGLYRISRVGSSVTIYYLNSSNVWTALSGGGTGLITSLLIDTQHFSINVAETIALGEYSDPGAQSFQINVSDTILLSEDNASVNPIYSIDTFSTTVAENSLFLANLNNVSRYISSNGTTVVDSSSQSGHLFNCPNANIINYYKERLYVADFIYSGIRYKTSVLRSSPPLGIVALVNDDITSSTATSITVTDNKYIYAPIGTSYSFGMNVNEQFIISEGIHVSVAGGTPSNTESVSLNFNSLEVYRGNKKVATVIVSSVQEDTITLSSPPKYESGFSTILSADELWAPGTFNGAKQIRWVQNPTTGGVNVKSYDTFKILGQDNEEIKMMVNVGNVMIISNNNSISVWNNFVLQNLDGDVGCVSKKGYVKSSGSLFFIHWTGIYKMDGASAPQRISEKIQRYFDGATKSGKETSTAGKKGRNVFFTLGTVTLTRPDGSTEKTMSNVCIEYNIVHDNWYVHTGVDAVEFTTWVEETDSDRLVMVGGDSDTTALEFLSGLTDNGREIPIRVDTPNLMLGATFERISNPLEIIIESERGSGLKCFISLDYGPWYEIEGETVKGCTILQVTSIDGDRAKPPRCRNIRLSLRDNSRRVCKISKVAVNYLVTNEVETTRMDYI